MTRVALTGFQTRRRRYTTLIKKQLVWHPPTAERPVEIALLRPLLPLLLRQSRCNPLGAVVRPDLDLMALRLAVRVGHLHRAVLKDLVEASLHLALVMVTRS